MSKLRWKKNLHGTQVLETQVPYKKIPQPFLFFRFSFFLLPFRQFLLFSFFLCSLCLCYSSLLFSSILLLKLILAINNKIHHSLSSIFLSHHPFVPLSLMPHSLFAILVAALVAVMVVMWL